MSVLKNVQIGSLLAHAGEWGEVCLAVADELEALIRDRAGRGESVVLGLATGSTPLDLYSELIRRHREEGLSFANVTSFNLDEYEGLGRDHERSYWCEMWRNLFDHVDIDPARVHVPPSRYEDAEAASLEYEAKISEAGGIDWQLLGIGRDGHIGFNEPGSERDSRTRRVDLAEETIVDAAPGFGGRENVPQHAVTMGVGTILESRRIVLMAKGAAKQEIVNLAMSREPSAVIPASFLQLHENVGWFLANDTAGF
ncbi:glucosamine-6-phosphate deaminase [Verrucomicrobiaceae bacterium 227]